MFEKNRDVWLGFQSKLTSLYNVIERCKAAVFDIAKVPIILKQPENFNTPDVSGTAVFELRAANVDSYQWQSKAQSANWINTSASGNKTNRISLAITNTTSKLLFRCIITGTDGSTIYSDEVRIVVED